MPAKGTYLAISGVGVIFVWSGLKGKSWSAVLRDVISGRNPANAQTVNKISPINVADGTGNPNASPVFPGAVQGSANGVAIANDALIYQGHSYQYGGAPGPNGTNPWDCSSFVNWVLNHDMGSPIPGYPGWRWNPSMHGPNTTSYLSWTRPRRVSRRNVFAGDLLVWTTHMGIAINNTQMISALNPHLGTAVTGIEAGGPGGKPFTCMRVA